MVSIITVTKRLAAHTVVESTDLKVTQVPATSVPAGAVTSEADAAGHYTAGDWFPGQTVLADMVTSNASDASFPLRIPAGKRAYTMASDSVIGVDHLISVGDHVDVLVSYQSADPGDKKPIVKTVLQNVEVLYVDNAPLVQTTATVSQAGAVSTSGGKSGGQATASSGSTSSSSAASAAGGGGASASATHSGVDTITLALTPDDAQKLDYARTFGQVQLVLRGPSDSDSNQLDPTTGQP
jgi:pilus assembly protein CpaB